jgi:hypothetical protein
MLPCLLKLDSVLVTRKERENAYVWSVRFSERINSSKLKAEENQHTVMPPEEGDLNQEEGKEIKRK